MIRAILRWFGYYKCDYGAHAGRRWLEIDGKMIAQTPDADIWLRQEDVHRLGYELFDHGKVWTNPPTRNGER